MSRQPSETPNRSNHDWAELGTKLCFGPLHPIEGVRLPCDPNDKEHSAFWFFSDTAKERPGKPMSRCKDCLNFLRGRDPETSGYVDADKIRPMVDAIIARIGRMEMCRRIGITTDLFYNLRRQEFKRVLKVTALKVEELYKDLERSGEVRNRKDILYGTKMRGKVEWRKTFKRTTIDLGDQDAQLAKMRPVDETPPDKAWWVQWGNQWVPRWGEEMLGDDF